MTAVDADRYYASYESAIDAIGKAAERRGVYDGPALDQALGASPALLVRTARARDG